MLVRIYFMGLLAFVPESNHDMTVLVLKADTHHHAGAHPVEAHMPMLLARAGSSRVNGKPFDGRDQRVQIAKHLTETKETDRQKVMASMKDVLANGIAIELEGVDLKVKNVATPTGQRLGWDSQRPQGAILPNGNHDQLYWLASMKDLLPHGHSSQLKSSLFGSEGSDQIAARMSISGANLSVVRFVGENGKVVALDFKAKPTETEPVFRSAAADWLMAEFRVEGDSLTLMEEKFGSGETRSIELLPRDVGGQKVLELAIMDVPRGFAKKASDLEGEERSMPGQHFAAFYDLLEAGAPSSRPVPFPGPADKNTTIEGELPLGGVESELLDELNLQGRKMGQANVAYCPPVVMHNQE